MDRNVTIALILTAADRASAVIGSVFSNAEKHAKKLESIGKSFNDIGKKSLIAGAALAAPLALSVKSAVEFEKLGMSLNILAGSAEKGAVLFSKLKQFAADTPFELNEIIKAQKTMMGFGISADEALKNLSDIGDVAAITGGNMGGIVLAFSQAAASGKLMGQDLNQLINNGVPIIDMLSKSMGVAASQVKAMSSAGLITYPVMKKAFADAAAAGGRFAGGMEQLSNTTGGRFAKMSDNVQFLSVKIGDALLPTINNLLDSLFPLMDKFNEFAGAHPVLINNVAKAAIGLLAFGGAMKVVGIIFTTLSTLMSANPIILTIAAVALSALLIYRYWNNIGDFFNGLWGNIKDIFASAWMWFKNSIFIYFIPQLLIFKYWDKLVPFFRSVWGLLRAVFFTGINLIKQLFLNFTPVGLIIKHWSGISGFFVNILGEVKKPFTDIFNWVWGFGSRFFDAGKHIMDSIADGIAAKISVVTRKVESVTQSIRDFFPFSPAKTGPLKDIHRIKLIETIAQGIRSAPVTSVMHNVTGRMFDQLNQTMPVYSSGSGTNISFSPTINLSGGATPADAKMLVDNMRMEFNRLMREYDQQKSRRGFNS